MKYLSNENYIVIQGWMINELGLKSNELLIYAIIYGFCQAEDQCFNGSLQYLAEWTNSTRQGVTKTLKSLIEKGFIEKKETTIDGVKRCEYYLNRCTTEFTGCTTELYRGVQQSLHNNINIYKKEVYNNKLLYTKKENKKTSKFVKPKLEEVAKYCLERNNKIDPEHFIDYYESNGWKVGKNSMKDWKATIRTWERNNINKKSEQDSKPKYDTETWQYEEGYGTFKYDEYGRRVIIAVDEDVR